MRSRIITFFPAISMVILTSYFSIYVSRHPFHRNQNTMTNVTATTQSPPKNSPPEIKSLILWNSFFWNRFDFIFKPGEEMKMISCPQSCLLSRNKSKAEDYDALVFHMRDPQNPPPVRKPNQVYVAWSWESPIYRGGRFVPGHFYNWSATYARESTVPLVHGVLHNKPAAIPADKLPQMKNKTRGNKAIIAWIVSNCHPSSGRQHYVKKLQSYMPVDVYGKCGIRCPQGKGGNSPSCHIHIAATGQYKFYLAFENANCKDYISLKPFRALQAGLVPIVMGGLAGEDFRSGILPPNSFIDVRDFKTVKNLTDYLKELDQDDAKYMKFHEWRAKYCIGYDQIEGTFTCEICKALHNVNLTSKPRSLDYGAFWNAGRMCDNRLVARLLASG